MFLSGHRLQDSIEQRVEIAYLISAAPAAEDIPNEVKTLSEMLSAAGSFSATGIASAQDEEWGGVEISQQWRVQSNNSGNRTT